MDIFKLFFEHDLRLDDLGERNTGAEPKTGPSIEEFLKPDPTYSKFYLTGTLLDNEPRFGLNILQNYATVEERLEEIFSGFSYATAHGEHESLREAISVIDTGEVVLISVDSDHAKDPSPLHVDPDSNVGHFKSELRDLLTEGMKVLYKENAHHGYDLHLFSEKNIYEQLFYPFRDLVGDTFRFFSINSKRIRSERKFYFETWTLENPPHGAEEVRSETVL